MSIEPTQADRDAAAAYYYSAGGAPNIVRQIHEGKRDSWFRVQAFARHREQAILEYIKGDGDGL